jgi:predicted outer membrane protein
MCSVAVGLLVVIAAAWPTAGTALADEQAARSAGSLEAVERELITVIRFANLWEIPMGTLAAQRGSSPKVREVGATLADDHTKLDVVVIKLAKQFDVPLPDEPTSQQKSWMAEISSKSGPEFDRTFADRLRGAHGTVFGLVAEVRAGTRSEVIRAFAQQANDVVMKHMTLLESTGLVAPMGMFSEASARTTTNAENSLHRSDFVLAAVLGLVVLGATLLAVRALSSGGSAAR